MGVYIKDMEMPKNEPLLVKINPDGSVSTTAKNGYKKYKAVPVPSHGRLIDADSLRRAMYHEAFETDSPLQKWDSGCWIRYKLFERVEESALTIIPAEREECDDA